MKNIKTYEAWGRNVEPEETDSQKKKLLDLKKSWNDFEDLHPWDFEYFWNKISEYSGDYQHRFKGYGGHNELDYEIELEGYNSKKTELYHADKDIEWRKRNGRIFVKTETGGVSGGSCWDSSDPQPYETGRSVEYSDLSNFVEHILLAIFGKNHAFADIPKLMEKFNNLGYPYISEDDYTEYEYYGNNTSWKWYEISLWNLYQFLAKEGAF